MSVNAYLYAESASLIPMVSIARKCIGVVPISKCKLMYLPRLGDPILQILQFEMAWQMSFFMPFQKYVAFFVVTTISALVSTEFMCGCDNPWSEDFGW